MAGKRWRMRRYRAAAVVRLVAFQPIDQSFIEVRMLGGRHDERVDDASSARRFGRAISLNIEATK